MRLFVKQLNTTVYENIYQAPKTFYTNEANHKNVCRKLIRFTSEYAKNNVSTKQKNKNIDRFRRSRGTCTCVHSVSSSGDSVELSLLH